LSILFPRKGQDFLLPNSAFLASIELSMWRKIFPTQFKKHFFFERHDFQTKR
jgi:hypothetical protein